MSDGQYGVKNDAMFRQKILTASWQSGDRKLPRGITGCDIDHILHTFSDDGAFLVCEFKRDISTWKQLKEKSLGQARLFADMVKSGRTLAALCRHEVPATRDIDVVHDVVSYNLLCFDSKDVMASNVVHPGSTWFTFVDAYLRNPSKVAHETTYRIAMETRNGNN